MTPIADYSVMRETIAAVVAEPRIWTMRALVREVAKAGDWDRTAVGAVAWQMLNEGDVITLTNDLKIQRAKESAC